MLPDGVLCTKGDVRLIHPPRCGGHRSGALYRPNARKDINIIAYS